MRVVLDANVVITEGHGSNDLFDFFISSSGRVGHTIYIPELVIAEVVADYQKNIEGQTHAVHRNLKSLSRKLGRDLQSPFADVAIPAVARQFEDSLRQHFSSTYCHILSYPQTPHEHLVFKAITRKRPFNEKGSGYRDALIWETVLELASQQAGSVAFISKDADFTDNKGALHADLVTELKERHRGASSVLVFRSLGDFVDRHIRPALKKLETVDRALLLLGNDPERIIAEHVAEQYTFGPLWNPEDIGLSPAFETIWIEGMEDMAEFEVIDAREDVEGGFLLQCEGTFDCSLEVSVHSSEYELAELLAGGDDWGEEYVSGSIGVPLRFRFDVAIGASDADEGEVRVLSLDGA